MSQNGYGHKINNNMKPFGVPLQQLFAVVAYFLLPASELLQLAPQGLLRFLQVRRCPMDLYSAQIKL